MPNQFEFQPLPEAGEPVFVPIYCPPGYILLAEAVEVLGKGLHPDEWTGQEQRARDIRHSYIADPRKEDRGGWRVMTTRGYEWADSVEQAHELLAKERPLLEALREEEISARVRRVEIAFSLRKALNGGWLHSWLFAPDLGKLEPIDPDFWASNDAMSAFSPGSDRPGQHQPNPISLSLGNSYFPVVWKGSVVLKSAEVEDFARPDWRPPGSDDEIASAEEKVQDKGGRPPKYDRNAFIRELLRLANTPDGLPGRAELFRHMRDWCSQTWDSPPNDSTIRAWIADVYPSDNAR